MAKNTRATNNKQKDNKSWNLNHEVKAPIFTPKPPSPKKKKLLNFLKMWTTI